MIISFKLMPLEAISSVVIHDFTEYCDELAKNEDLSNAQLSQGVKM